MEFTFDYFLLEVKWGKWKLRIYLEYGDWNPTLKNELRFSMPVLVQAYLYNGLREKDVRYVAVKKPTNGVRWWVG